MDIKKYYFDDPYLFKYCLNQLMRRCVSNDNQIGVLTFCHSEAFGGHEGFRGWQHLPVVVEIQKKILTKTHLRTPSSIKTGSTTKRRV